MRTAPIKPVSHNNRMAIVQRTRAPVGLPSVLLLRDTSTGTHAYHTCINNCLRRRASRSPGRPSSAITVRATRACVRVIPVAAIRVHTREKTYFIACFNIFFGNEHRSCGVHAYLRVMLLRA